eukprot:TRINITY_DN68802_c0_g1_i1.p1 TRINITY_DN68802_c0_g1~~TRINITY_DN68802_c0_g1_i1.p1  ORF type:complete len:299 (-),score=39.96 TRINITY_DN68802_c0_g1_i1:165-1016(-)
MATVVRRVVSCRSSVFPEVCRSLSPLQASSALSACHGGPQSIQRRWWYDVDAGLKHRDKPAISRSRHIFVRNHVPVVLLDTVRGLGKKGQIVNVKRGYARHHLVPKGLGLFGTWENIDLYADPTLIDDPSLQARLASTRGRLPFDWVDEIKVQFIRWAREDNLEYLLEPVTVWDLLEELSEKCELDLLPGNVDLPENGFDRAGIHDVPVRIPFRSADVASGRYTLRAEVLTRQSQEDLLRVEEMTRAVEQSRRFELPQRAQRIGGGEGDVGDFDSDLGEERGP